MGNGVLYLADWVLPVASPPIHRGAVLVDGSGRIAAVGPAVAIDAQEVERVELQGCALLPGLVDVHGHAELAMFRGFLEDLPFRDWILRLVAAKRSALVEADSLAAARWTTVEAVRAGITTFASTESSGAGVAALSEAGMRGIVYQEVFGPAPEQAEEALRGLVTAVERLVGEASDLVQVGISPHAPYTVSDPLFVDTARLAREGGWPIAIHIAESQAERSLVTRGAGEFAPGLRARGIETPARGRSPIELLDRLGVLAARPLLIHCVDIDEEDIRRIAEADCAVAHCPIANAKLGHGLAPLPALLAAGVRVGLGTDSVGSNNRLDLLEEARFASLLQRAARRSPSLLGADEMLRLCTIDGATALGLADRVGTLEPGKDADLCAVDLGTAHAVPVHDPLAALFHSARGADVVLTTVRGRTLYRRGEFPTIDVARARAGVEAAAARMVEAR